MTRYDSRQFWGNQGFTHSKDETALKRKGWVADVMDAQERILPQLVIAIQPKSVLEVGCGYGRMTKLIRSVSSVERYLALDLSAERIQEARRDVPNVEYRERDFGDAAISEKFDLVFACQVLMHIEPPQIANFIRAMKRCSKMYVLNLDYYAHTWTQRHSLKNFTLTQLHSGVFNHNYFKLYADEWLTHVTRIPLKNLKTGQTYPQSIFHGRVTR